MSFLLWEEMTQNSSPAAHSVEFIFSSIFIWNRGRTLQPSDTDDSSTPKTSLIRKSRTKPHKMYHPVGQMLHLTVTSGWEFHIWYSFPSLRQRNQWTKQPIVQSNGGKPMGGIVV